MKSGILWVALAAFACVNIGASAEARPFNYAYKTRYAEVDFSWSTEAAAVPQLVKRFKAELAGERSRSIQCGKAETDVRVRAGSEGIACSSSTKITTSGQTSRLLSLSRAYWAFTGGAHGNGGTTALLWDRQRAKQIDFASLFLSRNGYATVIRTPYCRALERERKNRRGEGYQPGSVHEFDACPQFSDLALIPADSTRRGRFDRIHLIAAPYTAGSFAEGEYDIALPITPRLIAALKPEYRASFEPQRQ